MCGDLSHVIDGFRCRRCDGTIQEADLSEELMVDGVSCFRFRYCISDFLLV